MRSALLLVTLVLLAGCTGTVPPPGTPGAGIHGRAMTGPSCPVQRDPPDPQCADKPYHGSLAVAAPDGHQVKVFETDAQGNFTVTLEPGNYTVRNPDGAASLPRCASATAFAVMAGASTNVDVACDSGIR